MASATVQRAALRWFCAVAITRLASSALSGSADVGRLTDGGSTRVATFLATLPRWEATRRVRDSTRWARRTDAGLRPLSASAA